MPHPRSPSHLDPSAPDPTRIDRLEESLGCTEHEIHKIGDMMHELSRQMLTLIERLDRLERRVERVVAQAATPGSPDEHDAPEAD